MRWKAAALPFVMAVGVGFGQSHRDSEKPACDGGRAGMVWPPSYAERISQYAGSANHDGLQVCAKGVYRYAWKPLTVSYQQLLQEAKAKADHARRGGS
jgi:hypothetical protein